MKKLRKILFFIKIILLQSNNYFVICYWSFVLLKVYDILGREVATLVNEEKQPGNYRINFNASTLASGIYMYKLQAGSLIQCKKMILLK